MRGNKTRSLANGFVLNKQQNLGLKTVTYIKPLISQASREVHRRTRVGDTEGLPYGQPWPSSLRAQMNGHHRATLRAVAEFEMPAMRRCDGLHNGQSKPGAAGCARS